MQNTIINSATEKLSPFKTLTAEQESLVTDILLKNILRKIILQFLRYMGMPEQERVSYWHTYLMKSKLRQGLKKIHHFIKPPIILWSITQRF